MKDYPYRGFGMNDMTLDLDPALQPDFLMDARERLPLRPFECGDDLLRELPWNAVLIDRPYSRDDAAHYVPGADALPDANRLLKNALDVVEPGSRVGFLDYVWPHPGKLGHEVAVIAVGTGRNNRARWFTVFERVEGVCP